QRATTTASTAGDSSSRLPSRWFRPGFGASWSSCWPIGRFCVRYRPREPARDRACGSSEGHYFPAMRLLQVRPGDPLALELPLLVPRVEGAVEQCIGIHPGDETFEIGLRQPDAMMTGNELIHELAGPRPKLAGIGPRGRAMPPGGIGHVGS